MAAIWLSLTNPFSEISKGNEEIKSWDEATWIGLQTGCKVENNKCTVRGNGCYWPVGERPRIDESDKDPKAVDACSTTYSHNFLGKWEDGQLYNHTESLEFWASGEPNDKELENGGAECQRSAVDKRMPVDGDLSRAYCLRGVDGKPDIREHCAQIFPADESMTSLKEWAMKWNDYFCYFRNRGYICERNAVKSPTSVNDEL